MKDVKERQASVMEACQFSCLLKEKYFFFFIRKLTHEKDLGAE